MENVEMKIMVTPEEKLAIEALLRRMRAGEGSQPPQLQHFLTRKAHLIIYKENVLEYHCQYIDNQNLTHKQLMLHYAAIYYALAYTTGSKLDEFHGPDFDKFLYVYCGITYNTSDTSRGRYRQVQDVYMKYSQMIKHGAEYPAKRSEQIARKDFIAFKDNMLRIIGAKRNNSYKGAIVPTKF